MRTRLSLAAGVVVMLGLGTRGVELGPAVTFASGAFAQAPIVVTLRDYATLPMTGSLAGTGNAGPLARVNVMREEPGGAGRFFVADLNGPLYVLDKTSRAFVTYLDFNGRDGKPGMFDRFAFSSGLANGLNGFAFDPDYRQNGRFYSVHIEETGVAGSLVPDKTTVPGLDLAGYAPTAAIKTPGAVTREAVVIEWTDRNIANATFEGTAREVLRVELNLFMHPMGELIFNPTAEPGDPDWRVLYIGCGDSGAGEQRDERRDNPQRLDTLVGKILRIVPDPSLHTATSVVSDNGRYRIPRDNPFFSVEGARGEIWAYGFRNPHRLSWDVDPVSRANSRLIAASVGLHTWESIYIVQKGANYGYSAREGNERLEADNTTTVRPAEDQIPVRVTGTVTRGVVTPRYPVIQYPHTAAGGDAVTTGFVYRGTRLPALKGKFIFADITTGKLWYADYKAMLAADDSKPDTQAPFYEVRVKWQAPASSAPAVYPTMFPVVLAAYKARGGTDPDLPGTSTVSGPGRADIRIAEDAKGELFVFSKADGMIREVVGIE